MGGRVLEVLDSYVFPAYEKVFEDFVKIFEQFKSKEALLKLFSKLIVNSFYGSLALTDDNTFTIVTFDENEFNVILKNTSIVSFYKINLVYIIVIEINEKSKQYFGTLHKKKFKTNVAYAAAITAKARIKLYNLFLDVQRDGGRVLYCDTDSIFAAYPKSNQKETCAGVK
jgi:DNA polymerase elongation subunit (family B)